MANTDKSPVTAQAFLQTLAQRISESNRDLEIQLSNASVLLRKRLRDLNDDDRTGCFSPYTGAWTSIDLAGIYSWNIVKRTIRANTSSLITAKIKLMAEPPSIKNITAEMASQVATALLEQFEQKDWTKQLTEFVANEMQLGAGVFLQTAINPHKKRYHSTPKFEKNILDVPGVAECSVCGQQSEVMGNDGLDLEVESEIAMVECQHCGGQAVMVQAPQSKEIDVQTGSEQFSTGCPEVRAFPFWEFRVDENGTQGGNLEKARWFEHRYIVSLDELQLEYPESADAIAGQGIEWSYALRWQYILMTGRSSPVTFPKEMVVESREIRDLYLTPAMYLNHPIAEKLVLKDGEGNIRFEVPANATFDKGKFEGKPFEEPPVLCFRLVGSELIDIYPSDFRKEWTYAGFLMNSATFWALFATELITLQDIVNYMLTIQMYHIRRNAISSIIYNSQAIDPEAFGEDLIPTKNTLPIDVPIGQTFGVIPALQLQEPMQMLQTTMAVQGEITQVQPAMVGEAQPNQPYAAQLLQKQQSLGLLSPASTSLAAAKVKMAKQWLRLRQQTWTDEDTASMLATFTDWNDKFISAFLETDIDHDIHIDYMQGSEIPQSLIERELKLRQVMQDLMQLAAVGDGSLVKPEMLNELLTEMIQAGGIEIDVNNTESDLRLAEMRYDSLLEAMEANPYPPSDDPMWNQGMAQQILQAAIFQPMMFEGHDTIIEFYADKARQELTAEMPNYLLVTCLQGLIDLEQKAQVAQAQRMMQMQMAAQAPMMEQQMAMQQQQQAAEAESASAEREAQAGQAEAQQVESSAERDARLTEKALDLMNAEEDRKLKRDEMKMRSKTNGK